MSSDTVAVDREALEQVVIATMRALDKPSEAVDRILASGILLDVAAVRHEHGERIAKALAESDAPDWAVAMVRFVSRPPP